MVKVKFNREGAPYTSGMGGGDPGGYLPSHPDDPDPSEEDHYDSNNETESNSASSTNNLEDKV